MGGEKNGRTSERGKLRHHVKRKAPRASIKVLIFFRAEEWAYKLITSRESGIEKSGRGRP